MVLWSACSLIGKSLSFAQILLFLPLALDVSEGPASGLFWAWNDMI
jgi:hypothetical protein